MVTAEAPEGGGSLKRRWKTERIRWTLDVVKGSRLLTIIIRIPMNQPVYWKVGGFFSWLKWVPSDVFIYLLLDVGCRQGRPLVFFPPLIQTWGELEEILGPLPQKDGVFLVLVFKKIKKKGQQKIARKTFSGRKPPIFFEGKTRLFFFAGRLGLKKGKANTPSLKLTARGRKSMVGR